MAAVSSFGLESAILNIYFRSGRTVFPMCHLDVWIEFSNTVTTLYYMLYYSLSLADILVRVVVKSSGLSVTISVSLGYGLRLYIYG